MYTRAMWKFVPGNEVSNNFDINSELFWFDWSHLFVVLSSESFWTDSVKRSIALTTSYTWFIIV